MTTGRTDHPDIRYGVIGTGMMGREHIMNVNALQGARVVSIADPHDESIALGQQAAQLEDAQCHYDYRALLEEDLDAIVIATPDNAHAQVAIDAMETNVHILLEKPLATTIADCDLMIAAAEHRNGLVWMGMEYRYKPAIARLISEAASGAAGRIWMVAIREHRFPFLPKVGAWNRFNSTTGGTLVEKCCHFFDLMNAITGASPVRVFASGAQNVNHLDEVYDGEVPDVIDNAYVVVEFDNGVRAMLDLCMFAEGSKNEQELTVVGDKGKVEAFVTESIVRIGERTQGNVIEHHVHDDRIAYVGLHEGSSYLEHLDFLDAIRNGTPPKVTLQDGKLAVAMGIAGHLSIDEERWVRMEEIL